MALEYRVVARPSTFRSGVAEVVASSLGRLSNVAENRYEITNISMEIFDASTWDSGNTSQSSNHPATILYLIPIYKLSGTKVKTLSDGVNLPPEAFDQGKTPSLAIVRAHEAKLRMQLSQALNGGHCDDQPGSW
jgi:hypothetical protein